MSRRCRLVWAVVVMVLGGVSVRASLAHEPPQTHWFDPADGGGSMAYVALFPAEAARYRVYVIPGSGCRGMAPIAAAYFAGLRSAEVVILHKRYVDPARWPGPDDCGAAFVAHDDLARWKDDARAFLDWHLRQMPLRPAQPVVLVGISEGAELVPALVPGLAEVSQVVLVGSTGLDPLEALRMQAQRLGAAGFVDQMLRRARDVKVADASVWAGRSMAYWRSLVQWPLAESLLQLRVPVWMAFGAQDAQVPLAGLAHFMRRAKAAGRDDVRAAVFANADHGLQSAGGDGLQTLWGWVEAAMHEPSPPACGDEVENGCMQGLLFLFVGRSQDFFDPLNQRGPRTYQSVRNSQQQSQ